MRLTPLRALRFTALRGDMRLTPLRAIRFAALRGGIRRPLRGARFRLRTAEQIVCRASKQPRQRQQLSRFGQGGVRFPF